MRKWQPADFLISCLTKHLFVPRVPQLWSVRTLIKTEDHISELKKHCRENDIKFLEAWGKISRTRLIYLYLHNNFLQEFIQKDNASLNSFREYQYWNFLVEIIFHLSQVDSALVCIICMIRRKLRKIGKSIINRQIEKFVKMTNWKNNILFYRILYNVAEKCGFKGSIKSSWYII